MPVARGGRRGGGLRQLPAIAVLTVVTAGLLLAARGHWRVGSAVLGLGLLLACVLRLVLPSARAGWLVVRSRAFDGALLLLTGLAVLALAATIPRPR